MVRALELLYILLPRWTHVVTHLPKQIECTIKRVNRCNLWTLVNNNVSIIGSSIAIAVATLTRCDGQREVGPGRNTGTLSFLLNLSVNLKLL